MQHTNYFNFWTEEENCLVHERGVLALAINFADLNEVSNSIYEYDQMLGDVLNLSQEIIHYGMGWSMHTLVKLIVDNQFVVVKRDTDCNISVLGQYPSNDEAYAVIKEDFLVRTKEETYDFDEDYTEYVIVNLEHTIPYFFGKGMLRESPKTKAGTFYNAIGDMRK
jgi:CRISPR/Cas system CSM-associated protein Csm5 (group 7 of RAMP superfamily)